MKQQRQVGDTVGVSRRRITMCDKEPQRELAARATKRGPLAQLVAPASRYHQ